MSQGEPNTFQTVDLDTLQRFTQGKLSPKEYLTVYKAAGELQTILFKHLRPNEFVTLIQDWPEVRRKSHGRQYFTLKTLMLLTPFVLGGGTAFILLNPKIAFAVGAGWMAIFAIFAGIQLINRMKARKLTHHRSVVVVTNIRLMRVWLDGTEEVQSYDLTPESKKKDAPLEPVSSTIKLLLELDLGQVSSN